MILTIERWGILAFQLTIPIEVPLVNLLALRRLRSANKMLGSSPPGRGPLPAWSSPGPDEPISQVDRPAYQSMRRAELHDIASKKGIPSDNKTANRLRLELLGWVRGKQADSAPALMMLFMEAEHARLERRLMRQERVLKYARLQADKILKLAEDFWNHGGDSPLGAADRCTRLLQRRFEENDDRDAMDLEQHEEEEEEEEEE
jgi:hypothetical protein